MTPELPLDRSDEDGCATQPAEVGSTSPGGLPIVGRIDAVHNFGVRSAPERNLPCRSTVKVLSAVAALAMAAGLSACDEQDIAQPSPR